MSYKEGCGIKCEVNLSVEKGRLKGKIVCQEVDSGQITGEPFTELIDIAGDDEMALSIFGGRLKVGFVEIFQAFHG